VLVHAVVKLSHRYLLSEILRRIVERRELLEIMSALASGSPNTAPGGSKLVNVSAVHFTRTFTSRRCTARASESDRSCGVVGGLWCV
jgi:hypothetical protein